MAQDPDIALRESGDVFMPRFDAQGLIAAVAQDASSGEVLLLAWMNEAAIEQTRATGVATFWSRSRQELWVKGETSGNTLAVVEILVDCDQDALVLKVDPAGPACHTGARSCFYRRLDGKGLSRTN